ncbi:unnamed protein product [Knipowitschia caucasica]|uniref:Uncharacterized protein n=1 Tax=Knipowitschia caucasica TaxID=637954 RepID=A0AAV2LV54_KNICA
MNMDTRLNTSAVHQLPENTNCLALSEDGQFFTIGHKGLSVWCATSYRSIAEWSQNNVEITSIQLTRLSGKTYLLGTIDDMGVARILINQSEVIQLLCIINTMENINNRSICVSFQLSQGGDYGVTSMSYTWLKECASALSQQDSKASLVSEVQWSPIEMIHQIKPLHSVTDTIPESHPQFHSQYLALDGSCSVSFCTVHFLLPLSDERKDNKDIPNALCVWWGGRKHLLKYSLQKTTNITNVLPGTVWPNANTINCSTVSACTRYIALGLADALVCIWDRNYCSPLSVFSMSDMDSPLSAIYFLDYNDALSTCDAKHLLMKCKSRALYTTRKITREKNIRAVQWTERLHNLHTMVKDSGDLSAAAAVPFLHNLVLLIQRNGEMYLQDVINKTKVCSLMIPSKHMLATSCNPVFALNSRLHTLLIQGTKDPLSMEAGHNQLYIFHLGECDILKPYLITPSDCAKEEKCHFAKLEDWCSRYLQDRRINAQERAKDMRQTWMQLQETSAASNSRHLTPHV